MRINFAIAIVCRAITIAKYRTDVENKAKRLRAITLHGKIKKKVLYCCRNNENFYILGAPIFFSSTKFL